MTCCVCGKGMPDGVTLFRTNEYGVYGIWVCRDDRDKVPAIPISKETQELVDLLDGTKR